MHFSIKPPPPIGTYCTEVTEVT